MCPQKAMRPNMDVLRKRPNAYAQAMLTIIAILLGVIALRPAATPPPVQAQALVPEYYLEPGTTMIRQPDGMAQNEGKVVEWTPSLRHGN
jgi:hypothetical protein